MFSHLLRNANFNRLKNFICKFPYSKFLNGNIQCNFSNQSGDSDDGTSNNNNSSSCGGCGDKSSGRLVPHKSLTPPQNVCEKVFRDFKCADELLGPGAEKCGDYKNPEYFGYHLYSYNNFLIDILKLQEDRKKASSSALCSALVVCEVEEEKEEEKEECAADEEKAEIEAKGCDDPPENCDDKKKDNPKCKCPKCKCEVCTCGQKGDKKGKNSKTNDGKKK